MEGGAVGPNSKSSWRGRKKGSIVSVSRRNTGGFSGQRSLSPVNQYPKLLFVKEVFLYYEGQTQGLTLSMPSLTMTEVDSQVICILKRGAWCKTQGVANSGIREIMKYFDQQLSRSAFLTGHN